MKERKETSQLKACPGADADLHCSKGQGDKLFGNRLSYTRTACRLQAAYTMEGGDFSESTWYMISGHQRTKTK